MHENDPQPSPGAASGASGPTVADLLADLELDDDMLAALLPRLEHEFRELTQGCTEVIWVLRSDRHETLFLSPAFERVWGRSREELRTNPRAWMESLHPDDAERMVGRVERIRQDGYDEEYRIVRPDGEVRWIRDRAFPIRDPDGSIRRLVGIASDVTDRKTAEAQMERQQEVLLRLALQSADGTADLQPVLERITEAAAHCLDVERVSVWVFEDDKSVMDCVELYTSSTDEHGACESLRAEDFPRYFEALMAERAIAADDAHSDPRTSEFSEAYLTPLGITAMLDAPVRVGGELRGVLCHEHVGSARTWSPADQGFAASAADLVSLSIADHERRQQELERRVLESKFAQAQKMESLGVLAGGIAHDFNNLLQGVLANTELARRALADDSPAAARLSAVGAAARRAAELCDELLAYSGQGEFTVRPVHLGEIVHEMSHLLEAAISKRCELDVDIPDDLPLVRADGTQIRQVVLNLITNAAEAIGDGPGRIEVRAGVRDCTSHELQSSWRREPLPAGRYVQIEVKDTGSGMDEETLRRIFDPFFTTKFTGRGLGLAATLGIMRAHDGVIQVESTPGEGTRFLLSFPALPDGTPREAPPATPVRTTSDGRTILVVDDEEMVRMAAEAMLDGDGYRVLEAQDGESALATVRAADPPVDCVILDLVMPGMGGEQVLDELRRTHPDLPVLVSSGYSRNRMPKELAEDPSVGFIKKPYDMDQLLDAVSEALSEGGRADA